MKKLDLVLPTILFVLLGFSVVSSATASSTIWSRIYEIGPPLEANSIIEISDGGYVIAGRFGTRGDFWLIKIDELGDMQWNRTYGGEKKDVAFSLVETSDGGYALAGFTESFGQGEEDFWLVKTDADGIMQWNRTYGGPESEEAYSLIQTSDGGYALAGYKQYSDVIISDFLVITRGPDFWVVKTDSNGNVVWNQTYGGKDIERAYSMVEAPDGGYVVAGSSRLVKIDSQGKTEWTQTYGGTSLVATSDGGYALAGKNLLIKTDAYGNMEWNQTHGGTSLVATPDGGFAFLSGTSLIKTDSQGIVEWTERYETNRHPVEEWPRLNSMIETSNGGYVIAGDVFDWFLGEGLIWVIKTDDYGVIPEFPSWTILPLFLATTVSAIILKKRLFHKRSYKW